MDNIEYLTAKVEDISKSIDEMKGDIKAINNEIKELCAFVRIQNTQILNIKNDIEDLPTIRESIIKGKTIAGIISFIVAVVIATVLNLILK